MGMNFSQALDYMRDGGIVSINREGRPVKYKIINGELHFRRDGCRGSWDFTSVAINTLMKGRFEAVREFKMTWEDAGHRLRAGVPLEFKGRGWEKSQTVRFSCSELQMKSANGPWVSSKISYNSLLSGKFREV